MVFRMIKVNKVEDEECARLLQHSVHHQRYGGGTEEDEEIFKR